MHPFGLLILNVLRKRKNNGIANSSYTRKNSNRISDDTDDFSLNNNRSTSFWKKGRKVVINNVRKGKGTKKKEEPKPIEEKKVEIREFEQQYKYYVEMIAKENDALILFGDPTKDVLSYNDFVTQGLHLKKKDEYDDLDDIKFVVHSDNVEMKILDREETLTFVSSEMVDVPVSRESKIDSTHIAEVKKDKKVFEDRTHITNQIIGIKKKQAAVKREKARRTNISKISRNQAIRNARANRDEQKVIDFADSFTGYNETGAVKKKKLTAEENRVQYRQRKLDRAHMREEREKQKADPNYVIQTRKEKMRTVAERKAERHALKMEKLEKRKAERQARKEAGIVRHVVPRELRPLKSLHPNARRQMRKKIENKRFLAELEQKKEIITENGYDDIDEKFERFNNRQIDEKMQYYHDLIRDHERLNPEPDYVDPEGVHHPNRRFLEAYERYLASRSAADRLDAYNFLWGDKMHRPVQEFYHHDEVESHNGRRVNDLDKETTFFDRVMEAVFGFYDDLEITKFFYETFRPLISTLWEHIKEAGRVLRDMIFSDLIAMLIFCRRVFFARDKNELLELSIIYLKAMNMQPESFGCLITVLLRAFSLSQEEKMKERHQKKRTIVTQADDEKMGQFPNLNAFDRMKMFLERIKSSDFLCSVRAIILHVLSLRWFNKDVSKIVCDLIGRPVKMNFLDMVGHLLSALGSLVRYGEAYLGGLPLTEIFVAEDPIKKFLEEERDLLYFQDKLYWGLPKEGHMSVVNFKEKLDLLIKSGVVLVERLTSFDGRRKDVKESLYRLKDALAVMVQRTRTMKRSCPVAVAVCGPPGIGKSKIVIALAHLFSNLKGRKFEEGQMFNRSRTSDYWEGHDPLSQPFIHYSEVGNETKDIAMRRDKNQLVELQSVVDSLPYNADMAFLGKGLTYLCPEMVIVDTNNANMNIPYLMSCPSALMRRFIFVHMRVKREYCKVVNGILTTTLDKAKCLRDNVHPLDRYTVRIVTHDANVNESRVRDGSDTVETEHYCGDFLPACLILERLFREHVEAEEEIKSKDLYNVFYDGNLAKEVFPNFARDELNDEKKEGLEPEILSESFSESVWKRIRLPEISGPVKDLYKIGVLSTQVTVLQTSLFAIDAVPYLRMSWLRAGIFLFLMFMYYLSRHPIGFTVLCLLLACFNYVDIAKLFVLCELEKMRYVTEQKRDIAVESLKYRIGLKRFSALATRGNLMRLGLALAALLGITKALQLYVRKKPIESQAVVSKFSRDTEEIKEWLEQEEWMGTDKPRVAVKNRGHAAWPNVGFGVTPLAPHVGDPIDLFRSFANNIWLTRVVSKSLSTKTYVFGIKGSMALINTHCLTGEFPFTVEFTKLAKFEESVQNRKIIVNAEDVVNIGGDLSLINCTTFKFRNVTPHLLSGEPPCKTTGFLREVPVLVRKQRDVVAKNSYHGKIFYQEVLLYDHEHFPGLCGHPLLIMVQEGRWAIGGIHAAGMQDTTNSYAIIVNKEKIEQGIATLEKQMSLMPVMSQGEIDEKREVPISKSPFCHEYFGFIDYYLKLCGPTLIAKSSRLVKSNFTSFRPWLEDKLKQKVTIEYDKPMMRPKVVNGEWISPYNIALRKINAPIPMPENEVLKIVVSRFTRYILEKLHAHGVVELHSYPLMVAINGAEENAFFRRVNASTGAGHGFCGKKGVHIPLIDEDDVMREPTDELMRRMLWCVKKYRSGEACEYIYRYEPKDEPRSRDKCQEGKTRLFGISPIDSLLMSREVKGALYSLMSEVGDAFCCAIGINMHKEAHAFYEALVSFSHLIGEGDFGGYDVRMPFFIAHASATVQYNVLKALGYREGELEVLRGVLTDDLFPLMSMNNDLFCKPGLQPSGKYGTAEENCLRNVLIQMYLWYLNPMLRDKDFFDYVFTRCYGDDLLFAVKPEVSHLYNMKTFARDCKKFLGMEFTSASKSLDFEEFVTPDTMSFLKRTFVEKDGRMVARLDFNSIVKMVEWLIPSSYVTREQQEVQTFSSALWELYFWMDEKTHDECREMMWDYLINEYKGERGDFPLPSYSLIDDEIRSPPEYGCVISEAFHLEKTVSSLPNTPAQGGLFSLFSPVCAFKDKRGTSLVGSISCRWNQMKNQGQSEHVFTLLDEKTSYVNRIYEIDQILENEFKEGAKMTAWGYVNSTEILRNPRKRDERLAALLCEKADCKESIKKIDRILEMKNVYTQSMNLDGEVDSKMIERFENVVDVGGEEAQRVVIGHAIAPDVGFYEVLTMDNFVDRPVQIDNFQISDNSVAEATYAIWDKLSKDPTIRSKLRGYAYFRGEITVRIQVSGTPFHKGKILIAYVPWSVNSDALVSLLDSYLSSPSVRPLVISYLSQQPGAVVIDVKSNKPVELTIPFISPKPMFRLYNDGTGTISAATSFADFQYAGDLHIATINTVIAESSTPSDVAVEIYAWFSNVCLGTATATSMEILTEGGDERVSGPVERLATAAATVMNALSTIPAFAPLAKASGMVFSGMAGISSWFGWSKPAVMENPKFIKNRPYANGCVTIGRETTEKLTFDPKQELVVDPRMVGVEHDELSLAFLTTVESYLTSFTWQVSDQPLTSPPFLLAIHPQASSFVYLPTPDITLIQPTALAFAATPFQFWRGDIIVRFEIECCEFDRGKFAVFYEPNISQYTLINSQLHLNKNFFKIIDIQEMQSVEFCVKWARPRAWAMCTPSEWATYPLQTSQWLNLLLYANGYIGFVPINELQSPVSSNVKVNVYIRGENMQFNVLSEEYLPTQRFVYTESSDLTSGTLDEKLMCFELNESSATSALTSDFHFGEQPLSFRSALKRFDTFQGAQVTAGSNTRNFTADLKAVPDISPVYSSVGAGGNQTLWGYLRYAYLCLRGGIRKRIHVEGGSFTGPDAHVMVSNGRIHFQPSIPTIVVNNSVSSAYLRGTVQFVPATNGGIEFELPFYSNEMFLISCTADLVGTWNAGSFNTLWNKSYRVEGDYSMVSGNTLFLKELTAAAEDFTLMRFMGAPYYSKAGAA